MYRVVCLALLPLALSGCGLSSVPLSSGFASSEQATASITGAGGQALRSAPRDESPNRPASSEASARRYAKLDDSTPDRIPKGTFEKAPPGALSDRDYSATRLDPEKARDLINAYRRQKGLKPLKLNASLTEAARMHASDLAKWDRISHYGSDGSNPWDRVKRAGYNARLAAENVGTGQASIEEVIKGWQASPGHNKNLLLAEAEHMGIALVQDPKTEFKTFWTLVIGAPM
jgi:uncharacterized protein YkwD